MGNEESTNKNIDSFFFFLIFWPRYTACGILVPWPGMEPAPREVAAQSLNHWTAREVPKISILMGKELMIKNKIIDILIYHWNIQNYSKALRFWIY